MWSRLVKKAVAITGLVLLMALVAVGARAAGVGEPAPSFTLLDVVSKREIQLREFRGRTVVMWVWDTVCPLCLDEGKALDRFIAGRPGLAGLLVIERGDEMDLEVEGQIYQPRMHLLVDKKATVEKSYEITRLPVLIIVDRAGRVRYRGSYDGNCRLAEHIARIEAIKAPRGCL